MDSDANENKIWIKKDKEVVSSGDYIMCGEEEVGRIIYWIGVEKSLMIKIIRLEPNFQGKGIGTLVLKLLEKEAKENDCEWIKAIDSDVQSEGFWKKIGMVEIGKTSDGYKNFGKKLK